MFVWAVQIKKCSTHHQKRGRGACWAYGERMVGVWWAAACSHQTCWRMLSVWCDRAYAAIRSQVVLSVW